MELKTIKERYPGYFVTSSERLLKNAVLVLDTNIYLSVIQYPTELSEKLLSIFQEYNSNSKLFVPGTVADEVIKQLDFYLRRIDSQYITIDDKLDKTLGDIEKIFKDQGKKTFPIKEPKDVMDLLKKHFEEIKKEIKDKEEEKKDTKKLRETIVNLMSKVGENYTDDDKKKWKSYFEEKIRLGLYPGAKDSGKDENIKYNDAYIWKQTIDFSKDQKQDIILVTADLKDDWWNIDKDTKKRTVKKSMINEFMITTGQKIQLFTLDDFFKSYNKQLPEDLKLTTTFMKEAISYIQDNRFYSLSRPFYSTIESVSSNYFNSPYPYLSHDPLFFQRQTNPNFLNTLNLTPDYYQINYLSNLNKPELNNENETKNEQNDDDKD